MQHLLSLFRKHWGAIVILSLMGAVAGLWLSLRQTPLYVANTRVLITQKDSTLDAYTTLRASEKMGQNLSYVIGTASFLDKVLQSGYAVQEVFPRDESMRREIWQNMLAVQVVPETSMLDINVYHADREQAARIVTAISSVLMSQGKNYLGVDNLNAQVVNAPLASVAPVKPQIPANTAMGFLIGFILSTGVTLLRELFIHDRAAREKKTAVVAAPQAQDVKFAESYTSPLPLAKEMPLKDNNEEQAPERLSGMVFANPPHEEHPKREMKEIAPLDTVRTMHDHVHTPFGGQYYFQHKLITLE